MDYLLLLIGLAALWFGTDWAIEGAVSVARRLRLSEFIVGVAILSIGSDLPELTIAIDAGLSNLRGIPASDVVVGSAIGSSMGQIGLVMGVAGLLGTLTLPRRIVLQHGGVMLASIVALALVGLDGSVSRAEGAMLLLVYSIYLVMLLTDRRNYDVTPDDSSHILLPRAWLLIAGGLVTVIVGAELTVDSVVNVATDLEVDASIIALFVVGIGTSLPELSISIGALMRKRANLSVGNLIGSNIFDTLVPVGAAAAITLLEFDPAMLRVDLPALFVLSSVVLFFFIRVAGLQRSEATIVLSLYLIYLLVRLPWP